MDKKRYMEFEHALRYLLYELNNKTERKDDFMLDDIKQTIIVFSMKDKFEETNEINRSEGVMAEGRVAAEKGEFAFPVLFYLIVFAVIMAIGACFYKKKEHK